MAAISGTQETSSFSSAVKRNLAKIASVRHSIPATIGFGIVLFWVVVALLAPLISPYDPNAIDATAARNPFPSAVHWFGTDNLGRDLLSRIIWGARRVLAIAPVMVLGAATIGILLGLTAGYFRGIVDLLIVRLCDIVLAFPMLILYMIVLATYGASATNIILVMAFSSFPPIARIVRGLTIEAKEREYIAAAKMRDESSLFIMVVEILPNARGPILVEMCLRLGYATIAIGSLGFLGIGLPPPDPDWGGMVKDSFGYMGVWPHMPLFPCAAISSLVIGFNLIAVGLRELGMRA